MPPLVRRIIDDLETKPAYVMNLRWNVVGWNAADEALFQFSRQDSGERNMLWMLFSDERLSSPHRRMGSSSAADPGELPA